jgi:hypothetical protein
MKDFHYLLKNIGCGIGTKDHYSASNIKRLAALTIFLTVFLTGCTDASDTEDLIDNFLFLQNLPANRWVKYHELKGADWWRRGHAGLAYDSARGSLLVFGSDTHGEDWDNVVHEFIPGRREWVHHGINAHPDTYKINSAGYPVAGNVDLAPWAMHTYDGVDYDPVLDALVIVASPDHNPVRKKRPNPRSDPIWIFQLKTKKWSIFDNNHGPGRYFGAATAYDDMYNNLVICKSGLWVLNLTKEKLEKIGNAPKCLHRTMAFDSWRRKINIFGSYRGTSRVSRLNIDNFSEESENWEELTPEGDHCPPYSKVPIAFDEMAGVFLLVVDDAKGSTGEKPDAATTFIYDPGKNTYKKLDDTKLPAVGMNFMMAWDKIHEIFFLLTGNKKDGISVWALRLDRN